jgi:hypothetical protein
MGDIDKIPPPGGIFIRSAECLKKLNSLFSGAPAGAGATAFVLTGFLNSGSLVVVTADSRTLGMTYAIPIDQAVHTAANANAKPAPKTTPSMSFFSISHPFGNARAANSSATVNLTLEATPNVPQ